VCERERVGKRRREKEREGERRKEKERERQVCGTPMNESCLSEEWGMAHL